MIIADCGTDISSLVTAIINEKKIYTDKGKTVYIIENNKKVYFNINENYKYNNWTILHCAAYCGNVYAIKSLLDILDDSFDIDIEITKFEKIPSPRTILMHNHPEIYKKLKDEHYI
jgi:hypothetical protein